MTWLEFLVEENKKFYFKKIKFFLSSELAKGKLIFPIKKNIFNAFKYTTLDNLKVVIVGQDPYHDYNQANGLAFSVPKNISIPPSLQNIYKELSSTVSKFKIPNHGSLVSWAKQGVLLLNTVLTVEAHKMNSHKNIGWEIFTDNVISNISKNKKNVVFMLWGFSARKKKNLINRFNHLILESVHPSPLSAYKGFFGCNHFNMCNEYLKENNIKKINWALFK